MAVISAVHPMTPTEFEEQLAAAEEDDADHRIEQFDNAAEWNVFVAASNALEASNDVHETKRKLLDFETVAKGVGIGLLVVLAAEGAQSVLDGGY